MSTQTKPIKTRNHSGQQNSCAGRRSPARGAPRPAAAFDAPASESALVSVQAALASGQPDGRRLARVGYCHPERQQVAVRNTPAGNTASWLRPRNKST